jgi:isoleucyl-tRNA synthetase
MLHRITEVFNEIAEAYETFQFSRFFQTVQNFCVVDLSNFYLDIAKDRLYISSPNAVRRRSCQTVIQIALENLARAIAPVLSHLAEDIWQFLPYQAPCKSVFEAGWVKLEPQWVQPELAEKWVKLRELRTQVNQELERQRTAKSIGSSLEAKVVLRIEDAEWHKTLDLMNPSDSLDSNGVDELRYIFLVSQVEIIKPIPVTLIGNGKTSTSAFDSPYCEPAEGQKCDRCWNYSTHVSESAEHPLLCERCVEAIDGKF